MMGENEKSDAPRRPGLLRRAWRRYVDDWRRKPLWRPGFRPKWWDYLFPGGAFLVALPFVIGFSWVGSVLGAVAVPGIILFFVSPLALVLLLAFWKARGPRWKTFQRTLLQVLLGALMCLPLAMIGGVTNSASIRASMRRGDEIVAALGEYRRNHWRYPKSLETLEESIGRSLPQPSIDDRFYYHGGWRSFNLGFHYPIMGSKTYDSRKGYWHDP
jgi:hypothetical protein